MSRVDIFSHLDYVIKSSYKPATPTISTLYPRWLVNIPIWMTKSWPPLEVPSGLHSGAQCHMHCQPLVPNETPPKNTMVPTCSNVGHAILRWPKFINSLGCSIIFRIHFSHPQITRKNIPNNVAIPKISHLFVPSSSQKVVTSRWPQHRRNPKNTAPHIQHSPWNIQKPCFGKLSREFTVNKKRTLLLGRFLGDFFREACCHGFCGESPAAFMGPWDCVPGWWKVQATVKTLETDYGCTLLWLILQ